MPVPPWFYCRGATPGIGGSPIVYSPDLSPPHLPIEVEGLAVPARAGSRRVSRRPDTRVLAPGNGIYFALAIAFSRSFMAPTIAAALSAGISSTVATPTVLHRSARYFSVGNSAVASLAA